MKHLLLHFFSLVLLIACTEAGAEDPLPEALDQPKPSVPAPTASSPDPRAPEFHRGVAYAHSWRGGGYGSDSSARTLGHLKDMQVGWVALTPFGYQKTLDSTQVHMIHDRPGHETDQAMAIDVARARELGIRVLLKPHLWIDWESWPGNIQFEDPDRFDAWFESYRRMILHYAAFADRTGIEALSLGCELKGLSSEKEHRWRDLVGEIRNSYNGSLLYASNWDEYEHVRWWDALDAAGINAYFPLSESRNPTLEELMAGAADVRSRLETFHRRIQKPIIFTEIGFGSVRGAAARPWDAPKDAPVDLELQRLCYEATIRTFSDAEWLGGIYWWKWFSAASERPDGWDHDPFSPRNKPAQQLIHSWYKAKAGI